MAHKNGFTPSGAYPKIDLPWTEINIPFPYPVAPDGSVDIEKVAADFDALKTQIDDQSRYLNRTTFEDAAGTRWATIVIAASDSTAASKSKADYVCTASNAGTVINNALGTLLAEQGATTEPLGRIVLLEGTYNVGSTPIASSSLNGRALHFQGMSGNVGRSDTIQGTRILASGSAFSFVGSGIGGGSSLMISDMAIISSSSVSPCISAQDIPITVTRCALISTGGSSGACITMFATTGGGGRSHIDNNYIVSSSYGLFLDTGSAVDSPTIITNNHVTCGGSAIGIACRNNLSTIPTFLIANNVVKGGASTTGISCSGNSVENNVVADNVVQTHSVGITVGGYRNTVSGNIVESCATGIRTGGDSQYLAILANNVANCTTGFVLADNAIRPCILGNKASVCTTSYTIAAGVTNAFVGYNDFGGSGAGTDAGTGTTLGTGLPAGGTIGQYLKKNSSADGDASWATITIIDDVTSRIAALGDLLVGTGAGAVTNFQLAPGNITGDQYSGQILITDATSATGLKWGPVVTVGKTAPTSPHAGDIWIDTT